jgi:hypothetical protein
VTVTHPDDDDRPDYLRVLFPRPKPRSPLTVRPLSPDQARPYARKALNAEVQALARAPKGQRNHQLNVSAFNLSQLVAGGYLQHSTVWDTLAATAANVGLGHAETEATLASAFRAGEAQPRQVPEREAEIEVPMATVLTLHGEGVTADDTTDLAAQIREEFKAIDWHALWADETKDEWILPPLIPARRLVALFSPPKAGKSLLMLELAVLVATGAEALGEPPRAPRRVLYVDYENDPRGDVRTRLQAMGYGPDDLENLVLLSFPSMAYLDTYMGGQQLLAIAKAYGVEVVIIDTISRAVGGEENANDTWLAFYRNSGMPLKDAGIACIRLDHTGKDESKGMRGGSAKYGDVDAVWSLTKVSDSMLRLDCTANRLPIPEKQLHVRREETPRLRHVVDTAGNRHTVDACVAALDAVSFPTHGGNGAGARPAWEAVAHLGYSWGIAKQAQRARKQRAGVTVDEDE